MSLILAYPLLSSQHLANNLGHAESGIISCRITLELEKEYDKRI